MKPPVTPIQSLYIEKRVKELIPVNEDNSIGPNYGHYMSWSPGDNKITLDSEFSVRELEAIVWWMKNKSSQ